MTPIQYIELLSIDDPIARMAFDSFKFGLLTDDDCLIMYMRNLKEKADFHYEELLRFRINSVSPNSIITGLPSRIE